jgi:hypothetical protein
MKFKVNDIIFYPVGPNYIPKQGTIVGRGRYENIYIIKTDNGDLISIRVDDQYNKWLKSINMNRSKNKSQPKPKRKIVKK